MNKNITNQQIREAINYIVAQNRGKMLATGGVVGGALGGTAGSIKSLFNNDDNTAPARNAIRGIGAGLGATATMGAMAPHLLKSKGSFNNPKFGAIAAILASLLGGGAGAVAADVGTKGVGRAANLMYPSSKTT